MHKIREIEFLRAGNVLTDGRREHIDTHADEIIQTRLLVVMRDLSFSIRFDHSKFDILLSTFCPDRSHCTIFVMKTNKLGKIEGREQIAVQDQQRAFFSWQACDRAGSAERRRFIGVLQIDSPILSLFEIRLYQSGQVPDCESDAPESLRCKLSQEDIENWIIADRNQRLRQC